MKTGKIIDFKASQIDHKKFHDSDHSIKRSQQRGVSKDSKGIIYHLHDYRQRCGQGRERIMVTKSEAKRLVRKGEITAHQAERIKNIFLIIKDGRVITTAHETKRFKKNRVVRYKRRLG